VLWFMVRARPQLNLLGVIGTRLTPLAVPRIARLHLSSFLSPSDRARRSIARAKGFGLRGVTYGSRGYETAIGFPDHPSKAAHVLGAPPRRHVENAVLLSLAEGHGHLRSLLQLRHDRSRE